MSHLYELKFDQMRNNAPDKDGGSESVIYYSEAGRDRKIRFVFLDGNTLSLSYGFLIFLEFFVNPLSIQLSFTSHTIVMYGLGFDKLLEELEQQLPRKIICQDERYNSLIETGKPVVNIIEVTLKN